MHSHPSWRWRLYNVKKFVDAIERAKEGHASHVAEARSDCENTLVNDAEEQERKASVDSAQTFVNETQNASTFTETGDFDFKSDFENIVAFFREAYNLAEDKRWDDEVLWQKLDETVRHSTHSLT